MKLKPLEQFICDKCGQIIEKVEDGWLEWFDDGIHPIHGFRIVHCGGSCYYKPDTYVSDMHLKAFMGTTGLAYLLSMFERNLGSPKELAEIIGRLNIPYYEEIRGCYEKPTLYDFGDPGFNPEEFVENI